LYFSNGFRRPLSDRRRNVFRGDVDEFATAANQAATMFKALCQIVRTCQVPTHLFVIPQASFVEREMVEWLLRFQSCFLSALPFNSLFLSRFACAAVILDAFSRKAVGWALRDGLDASLAIKALDQALAARRPPKGSLIHHSDRGVQGNRLPPAPR
jgi:transposase InsO family protein